MNEYLKRGTRIGAFIPVPASILTSELSSTTILIYGAILSRSILSQKNGWIDKDGLLRSAEIYGKSPYGAHLKAVAEGKVRY